MTRHPEYTSSLLVPVLDTSPPGSPLKSQSSGHSTLFLPSWGSSIKLCTFSWSCWIVLTIASLLSFSYLLSNPQTSKLCWFCQCSKWSKTETTPLGSLLMNWNARHTFHSSPSLLRENFQLMLLLPMVLTYAGCNKPPTTFLCFQKSPGMQSILVLSVLQVRWDRNQFLRQLSKKPEQTGWGVLS